MTREDTVAKFNIAMGQPDKVRIEDPRLLVLRTELIKEECKELEESVDSILESMHRGDEITEEKLGNMIKELADIQYVISGYAATFGIRLKEAFEEVHASNMTKLGDDGKPVYREDGKVMKGSNYKPPIDMHRFIG